jgi:hypothetical protein
MKFRRWVHQVSSTGNLSSHRLESLLRIDKPKHQINGIPIEFTTSHVQEWTLAFKFFVINAQQLISIAAELETEPNMKNIQSPSVMKASNPT